MGNPNGGGKIRPTQTTSPRSPAPQVTPARPPAANSDRLADLPAEGDALDETPYLSAAGASADGLATDVGAPYLALTGGIRGPAGADPAVTLSPDVVAGVDAGLEGLIDAIGFLLKRRVEALGDLEDDTVPAPIPHHLADLVITIAALALGAATAGIGGAIGAAITAEIGDAVVKELLKSAVKDVIDDGLNGSAKGAVAALLDQGAGNSDARLAFFRGPTGPLDKAAVLVGLDLRNGTRKKALLQMRDPVATLAGLTDAVMKLGDEAFAIQYRAGMLHWLDLLAQADLGSIGGRTDMIGTYDDDGLPKVLFGAEPRGVIRLFVQGGSPTADPVVMSAKMAGTNPLMIAEMRHETPASSQLPVEVDAHVSLVADDGLRSSGFAEIGADESGRGGALTDPVSERWLALYGSGQSDLDDVPDRTGLSAGPGARRLLDRVVLPRTFAELGLEVG